jgi:formamidopyrimidine-DNA glycosylase
MPELPEVETIKNDLRPLIEGRRFTGVSFTWPRMVLAPTVDEIVRRLPGQTIREADRRGKYLVLRLESGESLVLHMRMTGSLRVRPAGEASGGTITYVTAVFSLDDGKELVFCDRRKLGTVSLLEDEGVLETKLGPEPLDASFTPEALKERLVGRTAPIKALLCDQGFIAGIGNMYADEALFRSRLHPLRQGGSLSKAEIRRLRIAIVEVLEKGIRNAGASISDYRRPNGESGNQQDAFDVAHRGGQPCKVCSTPIERIVVRNRGTYFCPKCQRQSTCS